MSDIKLEDAGPRPYTKQPSESIVEPGFITDANSAAEYGSTLWLDFNNEVVGALGFYFSRQVDEGLWTEFEKLLKSDIRVIGASAGNDWNLHIVYVRRAGIGESLRAAIVGFFERHDWEYGGDYIQVTDIADAPVEDGNIVATISDRVKGLVDKLPDISDVRQRVGSNAETVILRVQVLGNDANDGVRTLVRRADSRRQHLTSQARKRLYRARETVTSDQRYIRARSELSGKVSGLRNRRRS